jgi:hypothetical protein
MHLQFKIMKTALIIIVFCFSTAQMLLAQKLQLIDKSATAETKALFNNLNKLSKHHTLFDVGVLIEMRNRVR